MAKYWPSSLYRRQVPDIIWWPVKLLAESSHAPQGDEYTYTTMIKLYSYSGHAAQALQVKEEMRAIGFEPSPRVWGSLLVVCGQQGFLEHAFGFWQELRSRGAADLECANALMHACALTYQRDRALTLLQDIQANGMLLPPCLTITRREGAGTVLHRIASGFGQGGSNGN